MRPNLSSSMTRKYFSQRKDTVSNITTQDLGYRFYNIFEDFVLEGYFDRLRMGALYEKLISDKLRRILAAKFGHKSHEMIPTKNNLLNMSRDSIFDLIEFLSDYVSEPLSVRMQMISNSSIKIENGLEKWRKSINECLEQLDPPYNLTANGNIEILSPSAGLRRLVDNHASPSKNAQEKVDHACRLFLKRNATIHDKRSALEELASVLEPLRDCLKVSIGRNNTSKLFEIANNYGIRHNNNKQKDLDENYMWWFFYSALSAIDLVARLGTPSKNQQK